MNFDLSKLDKFIRTIKRPNLRSFCKGNFRVNTGGVIDFKLNEDVLRLVKYTQKNP